MEAEEPRRADARRNRARIMQAAMEAFAADGMLVPLDEIARRAGVGAGTVYRNFATKEALFRAVVADRIERIVIEARALADAADPGEAFYGFMHWVVERAMFNHALCDALALEGAMIGIQAECGEEEFVGALAVLLANAQKAGAVRPDVETADVRTLLTGCLIMERARRATGPPGRMTTLACAALRPSAVTELPAARNESSNESSCEICGTPLKPARTGRPARFCSPACRQKAHRRRTAKTD